MRQRCFDSPSRGRSRGADSLVCSLLRLFSWGGVPSLRGTLVEPARQRVSVENLHVRHYLYHG